MRNFELTNFVQINGIGAASGIVYTNNSLFLISDSSTYLYQYDIGKEELVKIPLMAISRENISKNQKFDLESITLQDNTLLIFGSGATLNRNTKFTYNLFTKEVTMENLTSLYQEIKTTFNLSEEELNIEGVLFLEEKLLLFQRGNGADAKNGIIVIGKTMQFIPINLPKIKQVTTAFTDAIVIADKIFFLAAAENTTSTFDDGAVLGSIIGCIDSNHFTIEYTIQISDLHKFEGLTLVRASEEQLEFLLCEDNDSEAIVSTVYKLILR